VGRDPEVCSRLGAIVEPEHPGDDALERRRNSQRALPGAVAARAGRGLEQTDHGGAEGRGHRLHGSAQMHDPSRGIDVGHGQAGVSSERLDGIDVRGGRALGLRPLLPRQPPALARWAPRLLIDPSEGVGRAQVHADLDLRLLVDVPHARMRVIDLPRAARNLYTV